jgi:hypothetical protein
VSTYQLPDADLAICKLLDARLIKSYRENILHALMISRPDVLYLNFNKPEKN